MKYITLTALTLLFVSNALSAMDEKNITPKKEIIIRTPNSATGFLNHILYLGITPTQFRNLMQIMQKESTTTIMPLSKSAFVTLHEADDFVVVGKIKYTVNPEHEQKPAEQEKK